MPPFVTDYAQLMRFDRPVGTLLLLWPTLAALWVGAEGTPPVTLLVVFVLGTIVMRAAGCVIVPRELEGVPEGSEVEVLLYDEELAP